MKDGQILKKLFHKVYIEMDDHLYVSCCVVSIHLTLQISIHNLCNGKHKVLGKGIWVAIVGISEFI